MKVDEILSGILDVSVGEFYEVSLEHEKEVDRFTLPNESSNSEESQERLEKIDGCWQRFLSIFSSNSTHYECGRLFLPIVGGICSISTGLIAVGLMIPFTEKAKDVEDRILAVVSGLIGLGLIGYGGYGLLKLIQIRSWTPVPELVRPVPRTIICHGAMQLALAVCSYAATTYLYKKYS